MKKNIILILVLLVFTGCGGNNEMVNTVREGFPAPLGFWWGFWDGLTVLFAFIGSMFGADMGLYDVHNNGNWYDFGYILGVSGTIFGASSSK